jgi:hypothetical protein
MHYDARTVAGLLRYAVSLNTTAGLVSPTQRRLAASTYRAIELAAGVLEENRWKKRSGTQTGPGPARSRKTTSAPSNY